MEGFFSELEPFYPQGGRPPVGLETMLRVYFMQQWFGHSDPGMEDAMHDVTRMEQCFHGEERGEGDLRRQGLRVPKAQGAGRVARRRLAGAAQGGQRQETDMRGRFVQSQEQPHSCSRRTSLRRGQASLGLPQDALPGFAQERGAGLYAVCAGEFLHGAQEIDSCRGIGMPGRPVSRRSGR